MLLFLAASLFLTSCRVGRPYAKPTTDAPTAFKELTATDATGQWKPAQPSDSAIKGKWWEVFNDRQLNALEEQLNVSDQNIAAAAANVQVARALVREARSQYFPTVAVDPSITNNRISTGLGKPIGLTYTGYSFPLEASWEPDLFSRVRNTVSAGRFAAQASAADLENVRLSEQADLAADYYQLRAQDALKQVLDSTVAAYQEALDLSRTRFTSGVDTGEAVAQADAQLKAAQAQDTNVGILRAQYEHAIAVLTGQAPASLSISIQPVAMTPPPIPVGVPSELLERRPDIAEAERTVAQANAQIGVAQTAFYPIASLSVTAGFQSLSLSNWFEWPSRVWSLGPSLAETLFEGGLRRATVQQYEAAYDEVVANYRQTVLTAFQQVEDNLAALRILSLVVQQQNAAIEAARQSLQEAETRYKAGLDPYLNVIVAQTTLLNDQQAFVAFQSQQMAASVQLIRALGGGWNISQLPSEKEMEAKPEK